MRKSAILFVPLLLLALISASLSKPRLVRMNEEMKNASMVTYGTLMSYNDSTIIIREQDTHFFRTIPHHLYKPNHLTCSAPGTGCFPAPGSDLLVVANEKGILSLFAILQNDYYQFWSPMETGSIALFSFHPPFIPLPGDHITTREQDGETTCWNGCLLPADSLASVLKHP